jgi:hypothetical protein
MLKNLTHKLLRSFFSLKAFQSWNDKPSIFVEAFPTPVFWIDENQVYQGCNQLFADLIGIAQPQDIVGLKDKDLPFSKETLKKRAEIFQEIIASEITVSILYDCIIGVQDKAVWAQKRFTPLKNHKGEVVGVFGTIVDISEHVYRREKIDDHLERKHIISNFIDDLNKTSILSDGCRPLVERMITILKETSNAANAIWVTANATALTDFVHFATDSFDRLELFERRNAFLKNSQHGYLDAISINTLKEVYPGVESILFYRMTSKIFPIYDDMVLLINPDHEKIQRASIRLVLAHHVIDYFYIHKALKASKK